MAKATITQSTETSSSTELPVELQVSESVQTSITSDAELNNTTFATSENIYVVVKGHSINHNGISYDENQQIIIEDSDDAERLIRLNVVMSLTTVTETLEKANASGTVTINGH